MTSHQSQTHTLRSETVPVRGLSEETARTAFEVFTASYEGANWERFQRDLAAKDLISLFRDADSGDLKGFSTSQVTILKRPRAVIVFSGDTVIDRRYWRQTAIYWEFALILLKTQLRHPFRRVYWYLLSKGYRTYLTMITTCPISYPRYDSAPRQDLSVVAEVESQRRYGARYDVQHGVIRAAETEHVRPGLAPVNDSSPNPHVRFFLQRNPGHAAGDELVCVAHVRWRDSIGTLLRVRSWKKRRPKTH